MNTSFKFRKRKKGESQKAYRKAYLKAYRQTPKRKAYLKAYQQTPKRKAYLKAYQQTPKRKAYQKAYQQTPEYKAWQKAYQQTPEYKAAEKAYQQTPEYKACQKAYQQTPEYKAYRKVRRQTPEYKAYQKAYRQIPEARALIRLSRDKNDAMRKNRPGKFTSAEITARIKQVGLRSWRTGKKIKEFSWDHIVPLCCPKSTNWVWNLLPLSRKENSSKNGTNVYEWIYEGMCDGIPIPPKKIMRLIDYAVRMQLGIKAVRIGRALLKTK